MKLLTAAAVAAAIGASYPAMASQWMTAAGAVVCPSYFAMKEGEVAADRNDTAWLAQTGCTRVAGGLPVIIVQEPPFDVVQPWRVRIEGQTVYMRGFNIVGYVTIGGKRLGPLPYHKAHWECDKVTPAQRCDMPHN
jgi:hypothetical protein